MTNNQYGHFIELTNKLNYTEYRKGMWCKPIGFALFCIDIESMTHYKLENDVIYNFIKIRSNINHNKLTTIIKENECK